MTQTTMRSWARLVSTLAPIFVLGACASTEPPPLAASGSSTMPMQKEDIAGRPTLVYRAADLDVRQYRKFIVDPVDIYTGADAQFSGASEQEKQEMAEFMRREFVRVLGDRVTSTPGPGVARLHLTLGGLENNVPGVATVSHLAPIGLVANVINSAADRPGSFTGAATIAGQVTDSQSRKVLVSFVQKRYPDAMNIGATLTSHDAQQAAITEAAEGFRKRLEQTQTRKS